MLRIVLFLALSLLSVPALAADGAFDSTYKSWNVFSGGKGKDKVCYITATPVKESGTFKHRGDPYVLVTLRKGSPVEVSVSSGYPYKDGSQTQVAVAGAGKFTLFTTSETPKIAWANSAEDDKRIIAALKKGSKLTVTGESQKNSASTDSYALSGFSAAYKRMSELCK